MTNKDPNIIPGFIGEAMRNSDTFKSYNETVAKADTALSESNEEINHNDIGIIPDSIHTILDAKPPMSNEIQNFNITQPIMEKSITKSKVISGRNADELENNINEFLGSLSSEFEIVNTKFGTTASGLYYIVLYKESTTRV